MGSLRQIPGHEYLSLLQVECFQVIVDGNVQATVKPTAPDHGKQLRATVQVLYRAL